MNRIAKHQKDYKCIGAGNGEELERWKGIILRRPDSQMVWPMKENSMQNSPHVYYHRSKDGGDNQEYREKFKDSWTVSYGDLRFKVSPTGFRHTGLFPKQAVNWDWTMDTAQGSEREDLHVLNPFTHIGRATMACASAGVAEVIHVDTSKDVVSWTRKNMMLSHLESHKIRSIVDDVLKFVVRGRRRGRIHHAIIMNPPSYGRGLNGGIRRIEEQLYPLISAYMKIPDKNPLFFLVNFYTTGSPPTVLYSLLCTTVGKGHRDGQIGAGEIGPPITAIGSVLPCGIYGKQVSSKR